MLVRSKLNSCSCGVNKVIGILPCNLPLSQCQEFGRNIPRAETNVQGLGWIETVILENTGGNTGTNTSGVRVRVHSCPGLTRLYRHLVPECIYKPRYDRINNSTYAS